MKQHVKDLFTGFAIGTANIIPGVSGGTFLLIFGIYERVISALNGLNKNSILEIFKSFISLIKAPSKENRSAAVALLQKYEIIFLIKLMAGAAGAIITLSSLLKMLLHSHQTPTYGLFFGLILASVVVPFKLFKKIKPLHLLPFIAGALVTIAIANQVDPVEKIQQKSEHYRIRYEAQESNSGSSETGKTYTAGEYLMAGVAGAVAISAMVLPGISGSLVLILLGQYFAVLTAISGAKSLEIEHLLFLGALSIGMAAGLLIFVRLVNFVFHKFHDGTMAFLTGLIAGSLFALWPFKASTVISYYGKVDDRITYLENVSVFTNQNILPGMSGETGLTILLVFVGIGIMIPMLKHEK